VEANRDVSFPRLAVAHRRCNTSATRRRRMKRAA
jgi:hypothetical protein